MKNRYESCGGEEMELMFDKNVKKINLQLIKNLKLRCYEIHIEDWTKKRIKTLVKLHYDEALELKKIIDSLLLSMIWDKIDSVELHTITTEENMINKYLTTKEKKNYSEKAIKKEIQKNLSQKKK